MSSYQYNKSINPSQLSDEIQKSQITISLDHVETVGNNVTILFKSNLSLEEIIILDGLVNSHIPLENVDQALLVKLDNVTPLEKALKVQLSPLEGSNPALFSPNLCDKTTWYQDSIKVVDEILTSEDNIKFSSINKFWVNLVSGLVPYEDRLTVSNNYKVIVLVNGIAISSGFSIDYKDGSISFESQKSGVISVTYWYATSFTYKIAPISGKILRLYGTQIKATKNIVWPNNQSITFQVYVSGFPYGEVTTYKNKTNMYITASEVMSYNDGINDCNILQYKYPTAKDLDYKVGSEIRIKLTNDEPLGGSYAFISADAISVNV